MGSQTASGINSKSLPCGSQFSVLNLFFLLCLVVNACDCRSLSAGKNQKRSRDDNYFTFRVKNDQWNNHQTRRDECRSLIAGRNQSDQGVRLPLVHSHSNCSPLRRSNSSRETVLLERLERDRFRLQALLSTPLGNDTSALGSAKPATIPVVAGLKLTNPHYFTKIGFGTPKEVYFLGIDTGSDFTWIQCKPCLQCYSQRGPVFDPQRSSSFVGIGCMTPTCNMLRNSAVEQRACLEGHSCLYGLSYMDQSRSSGQFGFERLTVASDTFDKFAFGCGHNNVGFNGIAGMVGLGLGQISFPNQTRAKYGGVFSYCLPDIDDPDQVGSLSFGWAAIPSSGVFTELVPTDGTHYLVGLASISVGGQALPSELFKPKGVRLRTALDSGSSVTYLKDAIFDAFAMAFLNRTSHIKRTRPHSIFNICFYVPDGSHPTFPGITLTFDDGAELYLNGIGTLLPVSLDGTHVCLAYGRLNENLVLIGAAQQQRLLVTYDTPNSRVGFSYVPSCGD